MFERLRSWLGSYTVTAKTLVCVWVALTALYVENQAFHDYVFSLFARFPHFLQEFVVGIVVPVAMVFIHWKRAKAVTP